MYVVIKPDSRPDDTAIRARITHILHTILDTERSVSNIYDAIHACAAALDAMAMALSNLNTALAGLLEGAATKRGRPAPGRRPPY